MTKAKADGPREYKWPHPKFKKATDKTWLEGRYKFMSAFCTPYNPVKAQGHEGTKPFSVGGEPLKICTDYKRCPCTCHKSIDDMYEMIGEPRPEPEQSPEYLAQAAIRSQQTQHMLDNLGRFGPIYAPLSMPGDPDTTDGTQDPSPAPAAPVAGTSAPPVRASAVPVFDPTPTGRRAKGQLEYDVLQICRQYAANVYEWDYCTPKNVAEAIGKMNATEPPSTGAINAVWDRWTKLGVAIQDKKPSRFVKFDGGFDGSVQALELLKSRNKRVARMQQSEDKRGSLRPKAR